MKTAKKHVAGYYLDCPTCGAGIPDPDSGSLIHEAASSHITPGSILRCPCGEESKVPKTSQK